ncbi:nuclear transport factor 2 family protein [Limibacter armeniacum]|uniref:nuclear transport factor 2 family protein n=1 Tax=Limibacter armeniacum TaxID=466084 RepID=UPI002FE67D50
MSQNQEENKVLEVIRHFTNLMIDQNTTEMEKMVDKGFTLTHITGVVQSKEDWFDEIDQESMKYYTAKELNRTVKVDGDRAELMNQNLLDARIWGSRDTWRLQQIYQLEKRNGTWIILNAVASTF